MRPITTIIAENNHEIEEMLRKPIIDNRQFHIVSIVKNANSLIEEVRRYKPELVLLAKELRERNLDSLSLCRQIVGEFPSTVVIFTADYENPTDLREAMKVGARDFVSSQDFEARLANSAIELVSSMRKFDFSSSDKNGKVITLLSSNGGVGKTTIALNLAAELSERSKYDKDFRVAVFDFDLQFGDVYFLSNIQPQRTIADLNEMKDIDSDALEAHLIQHPNYNFKVLSSPKKPQYADIINPTTLQNAINIAKRLYDYIIIDSAQGLQQSTLAAIDNSDLICLVTTGHLVSLKNAKSIVDMLEEILETDNASDKVKFIVNKVDRYTIVTSAEIPKRFKYDVLASIPKNDSVIMGSLNNKKTLQNYSPNADVTKSIKDLAKRIDLYFNNGKEEVVQKDKSSSSSKGLLTKLFGK